MAIIKKIDGKDIKLAENSIIDHSQLSGRDAYGAHPISAIRKLPEKLSALKRKDEEHDNAISEINEDIVEINEEIINLHNKDSELTNTISEVRRHAEQIDVEYNEEEKELTFVNYNGGSKSFTLPKVDEDTLTYKDIDKITLKKIYHDETTLKGLGTEEDPLTIKYPVDEDTIITDQENGNIYATAIKDDQSKITPEDIRNKNEQTESELERLDTTITNLDTKVEQYQLSQQNQINDLLTRTEGMGGYLNAYDFETSTPTQEELTQYAIQDIGNISDKSEIYNGTKVKNLFNNDIWVLTNTPASSSSPAVFSWSNQGADAIIADANDYGLHGLVTGSYEYLEGSIDVEGHITIRGLKEKLNSIDSVNNDLQNQITQEAEDRIEGDNTLQTNIDNEINRAQEAEETLQTNIDTLETYVNDTFETKEDANTSHTELEEKITEVRGIAVKYLGSYIVGNNYNKHDLVFYGEYYYLSLIDNNTNAPSIGVDNEYWICLSKDAVRSKNILVTQDNSKAYLIGIQDTNDSYKSLFNNSNTYIENNILYDDRGPVASQTDLDDLETQLNNDMVVVDGETITRDSAKRITTVGVRDFTNNVFKSAENLIKGTTIIVLGENE